MACCRRWASRRWAASPAVYIRKVEKEPGELYNVEFDRFPT
jgi:hypothetical protein